MPIEMSKEPTRSLIGIVPTGKNRVQKTKKNILAMAFVRNETTNRFGLTLRQSKLYMAGRISSSYESKVMAREGFVHSLRCSLMRCIFLETLFIIKGLSSFKLFFPLSFEIFNGSASFIVVFGFVT